MSLNWVMLDAAKGDFVPLDREKTLAVSPPRVTVILSTPNTISGTLPLNIKQAEGKVFLTNQRIIYLPTQATPAFQSLQVPLLSLQDTRVTAPFFGPNAWEGVFRPTVGGGIDASAAVHGVVHIRLVFKEGGAFDFHSAYERIKEALQQAAETRGSTTTSVVDLEQLPAYEDTRAVSETHQVFTQAPNEPPPTYEDTQYDSTK